MDEVWKAAVGFPGYEVSSLGRVRNAGRGGRLLKLQQSGRYHTLRLSGRSVKVHWLVAAAFLGERPEGMLALHKDDIGTNNASSNIYYGSYAQNMRDAYRNGGLPLGKNRRGSTDLTPEQAGAIRALRGIVSQANLAKAFGRVRCPIQAIQAGRTWQSAPILSQEAAMAVYRDAAT